MEKISMKLAFLASLAIIAFCWSMTEAREMAKEEVNCIGGCPPNAKDCNCMPPKKEEAADDEVVDKSSCRKDKDCLKYCPKGCQIVNCNGGTCFCEC